MMRCMFDRRSTKQFVWGSGESERFVWVEVGVEERDRTKCGTGIVAVHQVPNRVK
jgi:hypothetical protein